MKSFKQRLADAIKSQALVILWSEEIRQSYRVQQIRAKAQAYIDNNPQPRATYLLG